MSTPRATPRLRLFPEAPRARASATAHEAPLHSPEDPPFEILGGRPCLDFVNTVRDRGTDDEHDLLSGYDDLLDWSQLADGLDPALAERLRELATSDPDRARQVMDRARALRPTLYGLFEALAAGRVPDPADRVALDHEIGRSVPHLCCLRWADDGPHLDWGNQLALERPLWSVVCGAVELLVSDHRTRLRQCGSPTCTWLFLDETRNHSRRWCDMKSCGNRAKARRLRRRRKHEA